jgi:DNA-binding response OmpR family regulator
MARILFVDGEPHIRLLCREELQEEGYEVQVAGSGQEVVRLVESFHPDVVILEMWLPDVWGMEMGRIVKGTDQKTRLIYFTHSQPPRDPSVWGADAFVLKSPDLEGLKQTVRRLLS